jgi:hypothetical protein
MRLHRRIGCCSFLNIPHKSERIEGLTALDGYIFLRSLLANPLPKVNTIFNMILRHAAMTLTVLEFYQRCKALLPS